MSEDTISRQAAIEAMEDVDWYHINSNGQLVHGANSKEDEPLYKAEDVYKVLNDVPSAQPDLEEAYICGETEAEARYHAERKKGKWIYGESEIGNDGYYCSVCGNFVPWKYGEYDIDFIQEFLFCNKCGAEMRTPVETARDIVHEAINNSVWADTVDTAKMHKIVDDKYAEIRGDANVDANT